MQNVRISQEEFKLLINQDVLCVRRAAGFQLSALFGYPLKSVSDGYVVFVACEYCGQPQCRCGAPVEWQGKRLAKHEEDDDILKCIMQVMLGE